MNIELKLYQLKCLVALLDLAEDEFSRHTCNDFHPESEAGLTREEALQLEDDMVEHIDDPEYEKSDGEYQADDEVMRMLAGELRAQLEAANGQK